MFKEYLGGPLNKALEKVSKTLGEPVTIRKGAVALSVLLIAISFSVLSASNPFWVWSILGHNDQVVIVPHDPGNKHRWVLHSETQDEALFRMKCQESDGTTRPQKAQPKTKRQKRYL